MARKVLMCLPGTNERQFVKESSYALKDLRELGWTECLTTHVHDRPKVPDDLLNKATQPVPEDDFIPYGMSPWENDHPE